jgi:hypothetical protein
VKKTAILAAVFAACHAHAQYTSIDLSSYTNYIGDFQTAGYNYPDAGYAYTNGGIPFISSSDDSTGYPDPNEGLIYLGPNTGLYSVNIAVDETGVESVYTEINSAYGTTGTQPGTVELVGSNGTVTYDLIEGDNIRDHFYGDFTNTVETGIGGTVYWESGVPIQVSPGNSDGQYQGLVRNDMQGWSAPSYLGELLSVEITYTNDQGGDGEPLVYGLTTSTNPLATTSATTTPGPAAFAPFVCSGIAALVRRRKI